MVGYAEMTEVAIWVQTTKPAKVQIKYAKEPSGLWLEAPAVQTTDAGDDIALIKLTNLNFGQSYTYQLWLDGTMVPRNYPLTFNTQPHWRFTTGQNTPEFQFAFGSCSYMNDTPFDRPGTPYGGGYEVFTAIDQSKSDFMVWLGDNDYYREPDWLTESGMRYRMRKGRSHELMQPMLARTPSYAIYDDHDYGANDSDRSFRLKDVSLKIFKDYFPGVSYGMPGLPGCFSRFEWVDCEFFMLDDRYYRSPNDAPESPEKVMFGKAQLQWLKDSLLNSSATFKFICNGNQMINDNDFECFSKFPAERKELFGFLAETKIRGIVFLSGDRHTTEMLKRDWPAAPYPFIEITSSPLCSGPIAQAKPDPFGVAGTLIKERNFSTIGVSGKRGDRKLTIRTMDTKGKVLWTREVGERELRAQ